ncbi:tRNA intron endonuclease, catalytic protein [Dictyocaulus viviparus]|uniref:tRNA-intron lyase n=1 Tax=Dictyocaulus viviparus TaxID=29172 RepID=A0A0D8XM71_DICVI|nr:tRNA intron endonuclease, catalytic protein [Dictyocaulus viviparus]
MIAQSAVSSGNEAPYILAPEQVTLLVLYGAARVRELQKTSKAGDAGNIVSDGVLETELTGPEEEKRETSKQSVVNLLRIEEDSTLYRWMDDFEVPVPCTRLPSDVHAKYLIDFVLDDGNLSPLDIISLVRLATQVKKTLVIAIVASDSNLPHYIRLEWFKSYTKERESDSLPDSNSTS